MNEFASVLASVLLRTWEFTEEAAPWLLLGFLFAGILKAFVPSELLLKYLGTGRLRSIFIATFVGIPLPLCSCGVIPTGLSLYERGASKASTLAFFIATPATTVTALFLTFGMLGWRFAVAEITASFAVAIATGTLAGFVSKEGGVLEADGGDAARDINVETHVGRIETVLHYGFVDMVGDVGLYILAGLVRRRHDCGARAFRRYREVLWWRLFADNHGAAGDADVHMLDRLRSFRRLAHREGHAPLRRACRADRRTCNEPLHDVRRREGHGEENRRALRRFDSIHDGVDILRVPSGGLPVMAMIKTICALVLLGLILHAEVRKLLKRKKEKCATCGRVMVERPVKIVAEGEELTFCCEHCAAAYRGRTTHSYREH